MPRRHMTIFDPLRVMANDDFFNSSLRGIINEENPLDLYEDDDNVYVDIQAPGYTKDDIHINIQDGMLIVKGESSSETEESDKRYHRQEIVRSSFTRTATLPTLVHADKAKAKFVDGILQVTLPKAPEVKPKQIEISVD